MESASIQALIASHDYWYHRIEVAPGVFTPGVHDSQDALQRLDQLGLPKNCTDLRVLDLGCRDGFFSFAMEERGAEVSGLDYASPDITGFSVAAKILESKVQYRVDNVYNLNPQVHGRFDVVLFLGVLYHLRNPMLALDRVRSVCQPGALLFVESQMTTSDVVAQSKLPLWQHHPGDSLCGDPSNAWTPNMAGLTAAIEEAQFLVQESTACGSRGLVRARATVDEALEASRRLDSSVGAWGSAP